MDDRDGTQDSGEWVSWEQAAVLVGCPVPTIDWYTQSGRIATRPFRGSRPTVLRESAVTFGVWWRAEQDRRAERRADREAGVPRVRRRRRRDGTLTEPKPPAPPAPEGWLTVREAADRVGVSVGHVRWLRSRGHLVGIKSGERWWFDPDTVDAYAVEEGRWVSMVTAADLVGCSTGTIVAAADRGDITRRPRGRAYRSFLRESVEAYAVQRRERLDAEAEARAAAVASDRRRRVLAGRPDLDHDWLTTREAAALLG